MGVESLGKNMFLLQEVFGPDWTASPCWKGESQRVKSVSGVGGEGSARIFPARFRGGLQVMAGGQVAANHLLCRVNDGLQPALICGSGSRVADGDRGGGLYDDSKVHHYRIWQVVFLRLLLEEHLLLSFFWRWSWCSAPPWGFGWCWCPGSCILSMIELINGHFHCFQSVELFCHQVVM